MRIGSELSELDENRMGILKETDENWIICLYIFVLCFLDSYKIMGKPLLRMNQVRCLAGSQKHCCRKQPDTKVRVRVMVMVMVVVVMMMMMMTMMMMTMATWCPFCLKQPALQPKAHFRAQ